MTRLNAAQPPVLIGIQLSSMPFFAFRGHRDTMFFMKKSDLVFPSLPLLPAIVGPTATGKSDLAIAMARRIGGEIISADSMQVYRYMDIGTAKPSREIRAKIPHHFIDILDPDEIYSAGEFARQAHRFIYEKRKKGIPLIVVGGTGLYIKALEKGLAECPAIPESIQRRLWETYLNEGLSHLYTTLKKVDPATAAGIHPNDRFRILRALGVFETTGIPLSSLQARHGFRNTAFQLWKIGLTYPRDQLYQRINTRVDRMMAAGWLPEVERLLERGYDASLKPMQAIGYRQLVRVIQGNFRLGEAIEEIKRETRHLAKRQITWFRKEAPQQWLCVGAEKIDIVAETLLRQFQESCRVIFQSGPKTNRTHP